ncbi:MAG: c-type cytochrome [Pirellulaceae bacterium]|nr:c-type cytochrome [Pirellulaceae bacterium]
MPRLVLVVLIFGLLIPPVPCSADNDAAAAFQLEDGDRVVLLGDGLIEQEQYAGWIEVMFTTAFADRDVTFRNLGWSADTPAGDSRFGLSLLQAGREGDDEGWKQLVKQIELTKPTVVVFGYGMASSLEGGSEGIDQYKSDFERLIGAIENVSPQAKFVFLSPISRLDDSPHNDTIEAYADATEQIAATHGKVFVDLTSVAMSPELRKDPIHLNDAGYRIAAAEIQQQLSLQSNWQTSPQTEALREVIVRKGQWWFHRSRPANMAYVFGFRKHEQGQNAVEIPKFDTLVIEEEKRIALLRALQVANIEKVKPQIESRYAKFTKQPTPEFSVGDELEVTLWAENPQLNKPIQMNFDPQGRLWVASSEAYPMIEVGQSPPDKVLILEDTTGDGRADKSTVFADGLLIPTGVQPGDGGCYVAQSTDLLFLKDTDGDSKADVKTRVLSGFGTEDTHHNLHTLRWGPDGRLYMNQSVYTRTDTETPRGVVRLKGGGGFRYNPKSMRMQIFFRGLWNSWGHQFDAYGQSFLTDGAGFAGIGYAFPGAAFNPAPKTRRVLDLISPGNYPKFASAEIIQGDAFGPQWQGSIVTCDFRANRVTRFSVMDQGAGFVTKQEDDLLRTSAATFRPIDVKQGPDGALYIADWSNPIINHGEVDFRDERRDRWHGRIWRVRWKGAAKRSIEDLTQLTSAQLMERLKSNDRYTRDQSRRVLIERGEDLSAVLADWIATQSDNHARLEGIWLGQATDTGNLFEIAKNVFASDAKVDAAITRVVSDWADPNGDTEHPLSYDDALEFFRQGVEHQHPRVRLESIRGLGKLGTLQAATTALTALDHPRDRFIDFALATTVDDLVDPLMEALESGVWKPDTEARSRQVEFVLTSIQPARASAYLTKHLADNRISKDGRGPWISLIGKAGGPSELQTLYQQVTNGGFDSAATVRAIDALADAQRLRKVRPAGGTTGISTLLASPDAAVKMAATRLTGHWKLGGQIGNLTKIASSDNEGDAIRRSAVDALRTIGGSGAATELTKLASGDAPLAIRQHAVVALSAVSIQDATDPFFDVLSQIQSEQTALELWRGVLSAKNAGNVLAQRIPSDGVSEIAARAGLRAAKDGGRSEPKLIAVLTPLAKLEMNVEMLTPQRIQKLAELVASSGNPGRGESIYYRAELACVNCHAIGGVGGKVGPDMTSLGASAPVDYLIESLYDPNAKIKENYHSVIVATEDGQTLSGIEVESTDDELVIRDANNKLVRVAQDDIVAKKAGPSLMPNGVVDRLSQQEQVDLITFLTRLGKPGNYDASQGGVGRVYEVFAGNHRIEQAGADRIISGELKEGWKPLLSRVNGNVQGSTLAEMCKQPINISLVNVYLRTRFDMATEGDVTFTVAGATTAELWIDGEPVDGKTSFKTNVKPGNHTVLVRLDGRELPRVFKLICKDVQFAIE